MKRAFRPAFIVCALFSLALSAFADEKQAAPDPLPVDSLWVGTQKHDPSHARDTDRPARLSITRREGDKFAAEYWSAGNGLKLEGVVSDAGEIRCKPVEVIKGQWESHILEDPWTGEVKNDQLVLEREISQHGGSHETVLKRRESQHKKKKRG